MDNYRNVYVIAEVTDEKKPTEHTLELVGLGKNLAKQTGGKLFALLLGSSLREAAEEISIFGADVTVVDNEKLADYNPLIYFSVVSKFLEKDSSFVVLAGHTSLGEDLLLRLAYSFEVGLVTDCIGIDVENSAGNLVFKRYVYGGNALATQKVRTNTAMSTLRARVGDVPTAAEQKGEVNLAEIEIEEDLAIRVREKEVSLKELNLEDAPVVVSGGRGMAGEEGFAMLEDLASFLNGVVGATRPPVDAGWISPTRQVGITGKIVAPEIYIAVAISGSSQHLSGMGESGTIIAINKDADAYIFKTANYGVVGKWQEVLPAFSDEVKRLLG